MRSPDLVVGGGATDTRLRRAPGDGRALGLARLRATDVPAFRRGCMALALAWLLIVPAYSMREGKQAPDFGQYYMGATMVAAAAPAALYPVPHENSVRNAGYRAHSSMPVAYETLASSRGVGDVNRFIQPPQTAVAFAPLAWLPYDWARLVWVLLMATCCWYLAVLAGRWHDELSGRPTMTGSLLIVAVALSPLAFRTLRTGQISPLVGVMIALATMNLGRSAASTGAAVVGATLSKYVGGVFVPILVAIRAWRTLAWVTLVGGAATAATVVLIGIDPFVTFVTTIVPTLGHSSDAAGNQALLGLLLRVADLEAPPAAMAMLVRATFFVVLVAVLVAIAMRRDDVRAGGATRYAAVAAVVLSLLIFSPLCWEHYFIYTCPFWGWLVWEARQRLSLAAPLTLALLSLWLPLAVVRGGRLGIPEPFLSHMLWAAFVVLGVSVHRLWTGHRDDGTPKTAPNST